MGVTLNRLLLIDISGDLTGDEVEVVQERIDAAIEESLNSNPAVSVLIDLSKVTTIEYDGVVMLLGRDLCYLELEIDFSGVAPKTAVVIEQSKLGDYFRIFETKEQGVEVLINRERHAPRYILEHPATLTTTLGTIFPVDFRNVSIQGFCVISTIPIEIDNAIYRLCVEDIGIDMEVKLRRCQKIGEEEYRIAGVVYEKRSGKLMSFKSLLQEMKRAVHRTVESSLYHSGLIGLEERMFGYSEKELARLMQEDYEKYLKAKQEISNHMEAEEELKRNAEKRASNLIGF